MLFSFIFFIYFSFVLSYNSKENGDIIYDTFSFVTSNHKHIIIFKEDFSIKPTTSSFSSLIKRFILHKTSENSKRWYYVHIQNNYLKNVQKYVKINLNDEIIKNTFILFLSPDQLQQISQYCLIKEIEPSEKIEEISSFNETNYIYVKTSPSYELIPSNDHFAIEKKFNSDSYIIKIDQNELNNENFLKKKKKIIRLLSELPAVQTISTYKNPIKENNIGIGIVQNNDQQLKRGGYLKLLKTERYIHEHGITGTGQVLTLIDEFLDFRHPMFRDEKVEFEFNKEMADHRKILYYHFKGDIEQWKKEMKSDNHGTHVGGIMCGKTIVNIGNESINGLFDGMAPDSKIVYAGQFNVTTALELEEMMNSHGSRISSNSWGDSDLYVDYLNHEYGSLAYRNPQSLFVFAAGNHGIGNNGYTVVDPGGSKNLLSVGYTNNPVFENKKSFTLHTLEDPFLIVNLTIEHLSHLYETSEFLGTKKDESKIIAIDVRNNETDYIKEACSNVNGSHINVLYGNSIEDCLSFLENCEVFFVTDGIVMTDNATVIENIIDSKSKVAIVYDVIKDSFNQIQRGTTSSVGPGNKGIMKPDLTAPGDLILSAKSSPGNADDNCTDYIKCGLSSKFGTSMSTPSIAGAAALISQYFQSGKWIEKVDIDGSTLRALLINSCNHPTGSLSPDLIYGHGLVDLSKVLPFDNDFGVQITPQNKKPSIRENGHLSAKFYMKSTDRKAEITLSYLDPMLNEKSPIPLTRDLDLYVVTPTGSILVGDHIKQDTQHLSTNEKIIIGKALLTEGNYTIHVFSNKFFDSSLPINENDLVQEFSVVVTGCVDNQYLTFKESSESPCQEFDPNHPDHCLCDNFSIGPVCRTKINYVDDDQSYYYTKLNAMEIHRVKFTSKNKITSIKSYCTGTKEFPSVWISPSCHLSLSEYEINGKVGIIKQNETKIPFGTNEICVAIFNNNFNNDIFYHIEIINEPEVPTETQIPTETDVFTRTEAPTETIVVDNKNKQILIQYIVIGVMTIVLVVLLILLIFYIKKNKDYNLVTSSQELLPRSAPLLHNF